ncbi:MAG: cyclodeaminase/cyclohydrolase family protein [Desulfobacterales bacterium]|nr:cyclodeaminase/cyclohydrolase family protein [Desulfobacterales bacterium]
MDFLRKIADSSPLPAGGAAVAYTLGLAIGLLNKIILLEIHRQADQPELEKNLMTAKKELEQLLKDVELLVKQDAETFERFRHSRRTGDRVIIEQEFNGVIEVSMKVMQNSDAAFEWIRRLYPIVPNRMLPHLLVASELIMGSINGSAHVVRANLQGIKSSQKKNNYLKMLANLQTDYQQKYSDILDKLLPES